MIRRKPQNHNNDSNGNPFFSSSSGTAGGATSVSRNSSSKGLRSRWFLTTARTRHTLLAGLSLLIIVGIMAMTRVGIGDKSSPAARLGTKSAIKSGDHYHLAQAETFAELTIKEEELMHHPDANKPPFNNNNQNAPQQGNTPSLFETYSFTSTRQAKDAYYHRYGGKMAALDLLKRGLQGYGTVTATAQRLLRAAAQNKPFVLAFAGYSVTVGRGNYYQQSFPFVLQRIIDPILQASPLKTSVVVRNSAIGGIPSFPYGFCLSHFLGTDPDVTSWDYSMNEGSGATAPLESYIRHTQSQLPHRPLLIVLESIHHVRCQLLQDYTKRGLLSDAICVSRATRDVLDPSRVSGPEETRPIGLQHWDDFGAPDTCPGRSSWHPKRQEHEMIGWMLAMYFCAAIEKAVDLQQQDPFWKQTYGGGEYAKQQASSSRSLAVVDFPQALARDVPANDVAITNLLYGHEVKVGSADQKAIFRMNPVSCRTNFLPASDTKKVLPSVVVSGMSPGITAEGIMAERSDEAYQNGWVLDVSKIERDTKRKVEACTPTGGLGYVDMKIALYGIPDSGPLRLWLPLESNSDEMNRAHHVEDDLTLASHFYENLVLCEANEKRLKEACQLDADIEFTVGGVQIEAPKMVHGAAEYLKRPTCVHVGIPKDARITRLSQVKTVSGAALSEADKERLLAGGSGIGGGDEDDPIGLIVDIKAKGKVNRKDGACCVSHIVWEQR